MSKDARSLSRPLVAAIAGGLVVVAGAIVLLNRQPDAAVDKVESSAAGPHGKPGSPPSSQGSGGSPGSAHPAEPGDAHATASGQSAVAGGSENHGPASGSTAGNSPGKPAALPSPAGLPAGTRPPPAPASALNRTANPDIKSTITTELPPRDAVVYQDGITPPLPDAAPETPTPVTPESKTLAEVEDRAKTDPAAAAAWVEGFLPGDLRDEAREFVVNQWSEKDAAAAAAWRQKDIAAAKAQAESMAVDAENAGQ